MTKIPSEPLQTFCLHGVTTLCESSLDRFAATIIVFFDKRGSEFCKARLQAFQEILPKLREKNVHVVGISVDKDLNVTATWAQEIGITFPLYSDPEGEVCRAFGVYGSETKLSERALVVVKENSVVYRRLVKDTDIPEDLKGFWELQLDDPK